MTFRFLHIADLHLDSAYGGTKSTVERLREAALKALENAASLAIEAELDAVLIAGDAFDDDRLGYAARAVFRREVQRLADHGVSVVYITGNHDPGAASGRAASLRLARADGTRGRRAGIHVMLEGTPTVLRLQNRDGRDVAQVVGAGHDTARVTDNLARGILAKLEREPLDAGLPKIGLLHTQVGTARGADGHQPYAPCSVADLLACDLDYWALGHVHVRGRVDASVPAYYPGNLQGRNARESGPKGGLLVELDQDGLEEEPEFVPLAPIEFFRCQAEIDGHAEPEQVADAIAVALDEAAAAGRGPSARELVVRLDCILDGRAKPSMLAGGGFADGGFAIAVREELERQRGAQFGEFLEVQLAPVRRPVQDGAAGASAEDLVERIEQTPSALREVLALCRERDRSAGEPGLERALIERLISRSRS